MEQQNEFKETRRREFYICVRTGNFHGKQEIIVFVRI